MKKPDTPFGLMFHHFYNDKQHPYIQGAVTATDFRETLTGLAGVKVWPAKEWLQRYEVGELTPLDACVTFDDSLRCQYDIALPVLEELGLTAFWFVYSSVFENVRESFEIYRFFRNIAYNTVEEYYHEFFSELELSTNDDRDWSAIIASPEACNHLIEHDFYSRLDRQFRYLRDWVLTPPEFEKIMYKLMARKDFDPAAWGERMWMDDDCLRDLDRRGHVIGLHSYSHPVNFRRLDISHQVKEYFCNARHLDGVLGYVPNVMAHPSNSYSDTTLQILKGFGIMYGFRSTPMGGSENDLELARVDSAECKDIFNGREFSENYK